MKKINCKCAFECGRKTKRQERYIDSRLIMCVLIRMTKIETREIRDTEKEKDRDSERKRQIYGLKMFIWIRMSKR